MSKTQKIDTENLAVAVKDAIEAGRKEKQEAFKRMCRQTNWHKNGEIPKEERPYMMGEGLGNCLGLEGSKYTVWKSPEKLEAEEEALALEAEIKKEQTQLKAQATRAKNRAHKMRVEEKINNRGALIGQRIFTLNWPRKEWERRAKVFGGLPTGVDVAYSDFGDLLMVPVIEEDDAKDLGIHKEKIPKANRKKDVYGRRFWIQAELKDMLRKIFGNVNWKRPLTIEEAEQFGVKVL